MKCDICNSEITHNYSVYGLSLCLECANKWLTPCRAKTEDDEDEEYKNFLIKRWTLISK